MIVLSIIQKFQLEGASRLDAEYYQPEYLKYVDRLSSIHSCLLESVSLKIDVGFVSSMTSHFQDDGIPLLRTQNIKEFFIDLNDVVYIDEDFHKKLKKSQVRPDQVLIGRSGTIGDAAVVPEDFLESNSADVIIVGLKKSCDPYYLSAFLNSIYGKFQIERATSGGIQGHMNLYSLERLLVPLFDSDPEAQILIRRIVLDGLLAIKKSQKYYLEAENLLLEELGLETFTISEELTFVTNLSDIRSTNRIDPDFYHPKYRQLIDKIKTDSQPLGEIIKRKKFIAKVDRKITYNYTEIGDINVSNGEVSYNEILGSELPANAKIQLNGGEIIISKVRPTRGAIGIIPENWKDNFIVSGAFSVFTASSPFREYLQVVLRSIIGKLQLEKPATGTSYPTITDEDVENITIPTVSFENQQKIAGLVRQYHEARKKSRELLEEAKRRVEEMIEKSN